MGTNDDTNQARPGEHVELRIEDLDVLGPDEAAQERVRQAFTAALDQELRQVVPSDVAGHIYALTMKAVRITGPAQQGESEETEADVTGYVKVNKASPKLYGQESESVTGITDNSGI